MLGHVDGIRLVVQLLEHFGHKIDSLLLTHVVEVYALICLYVLLLQELRLYDTLSLSTILFDVLRLFVLLVEVLSYCHIEITEQALVQILSQFEELLQDLTEVDSLVLAQLEANLVFHDTFHDLDHINDVNLALHHLLPVLRFTDLRIEQLEEDHVLVGHYFEDHVQNVFEVLYLLKRARLPHIRAKVSHLNRDNDTHSHESPLVRVWLERSSGV